MVALHWLQEDKGEVGSMIELLSWCVSVGWVFLTVLTINWEWEDDIWFLRMSSVSSSLENGRFTIVVVLVVISAIWEDKVAITVLIENIA